MDAIHRGEIKGAALDLLQSAGLAAGRQLHARGAGEAGVLRRDRFLPFGDGAHADVVLAGSLQEEEEGVTASAEARVIHIQKAVDPPGNARTDSAIICDLARRLGSGQYFPFHEPREIFEELREARAAASPITTASPTKRSTADGRVLALPVARPSRHAAAVRGRPFFHPDGKARFMSRAWRESGDPVDAEFPDLSHHRAASSASTSRARRRGASARWSISIPSRSWRSIRRLAEQYGIATGDWVTVTTRRSGDHAAGDGGADHPARHGLHSLPLAGGRSANRLTHRTLDPRSKIPEFKVSACRIEKAARSAEAGS